MAIRFITLRNLIDRGAAALALTAGADGPKRPPGAEGIGGGGLGPPAEAVGTRGGGLKRRA